MEDTTRVIKECVHCRNFNETGSSRFKCYCEGTCPATFGDDEYRQGKLSYHTATTKDIASLNPYKEGSKPWALWIDGWMNEKRKSNV